MPHSGSQCLNARAHNVVVRILCGETPTRSLAMGAKSKRFRILWVELLNEFGPEHTRRSELGNLHKVVHANAPEKRDTRGKIVNLQTCVYSGAQILQAICLGIRRL